MRYKGIRGIVLVIGLALVGWIGVSQSNTDAAVVPTSASVAYMHGLPASRLFGSPAIPARTINAGPTIPAFTVTDVAQYVSTHPMPRDIASGAKSTIVGIAFLTSQQVTVLLRGESTGLPDDALLCYVELHGTFVFPGPAGVTATYLRGYEVFDAHTGNILMAGGLT